MTVRWIDEDDWEDDEANYYLNAKPDVTIRLPDHVANSSITNEIENSLQELGVSCVANLVYEAWPPCALTLELFETNETLTPEIQAILTLRLSA